MAGYDVIAEASGTLQRLLQNRMTLGGAVTVTVASPEVDVDLVTGTRVNLFLYQLGECGQLKNQDLPGVGHPGAYGQPPLSLRLSYLLTVHSPVETDAEADKAAQTVLGDAMRVLHDHPILPSAAVPPGVPPGDPILSAGLAAERERLKITMKSISLDDLSKIWTALPDFSFHRAVAYEVSIVQIESGAERTYPRLVGPPPDEGPRAHVVPFNSPQILELRVIRGGDPTREELAYPYARMGDAAAVPAIPGDSLVLYGSNLGVPGSRVVVGGSDVAPAASSAGRVEVVLDHSALASVGAGPQIVQVIQDVELPGRPDPLIGFPSNLCPFVLVPRIESVTESGGVITVAGLRLHEDDADSLAIVDDEVTPAADYLSSSDTEIRFPRPPGVGAGVHPVRVRVHGAESIPTASVTLP